MIPGKVVGISTNGNCEISSFGMRDLESEMNDKTAFDLGSVTKIISTTAILMRLYQDQKISLDDRVADYLEYWGNNNKSSITLRHLLQHRSGLNEWAPFYLRFTSKEEVLHHIAEVDLKYPIDESRRYSDLGFMTLGGVIEAIYGSAIDEVFMGAIAAPLGMSSTQYAKPVDMSNVAATSLGDRFEREMIATNTPYKVEFAVPANFPWREERLQGEVNDGNCYRIFSGVSGHAGLFSTVADMVRFGESLVGGESLFERPTVEKFLEVSPDPMQMYGFRSWTQGKYFGHTGFPGVALAIDSSSKRVVALATNRLVTDGTPTPTDQLLEEYLIDE